MGCSSSKPPNVPAGPAPVLRTNPVAAPVESKPAPNSSSKNSQPTQSVEQRVEPVTGNVSASTSQKEPTLKQLTSLRKIQSFARKKIAENNARKEQHWKV